MTSRTKSSDELDRLFRTARRDIPDPITQTAFQASVQSALRAGISARQDLPELGGGHPLHLGSPVFKLALSIGAAAVIAVGVGLMHQSAPLPQRVAPTTPALSQEPSAVPLVAIDASAPALPPEQEAPSPKVEPRATTAPAVQREGKTNPIPSEASLIDQAHRQLQSDPGRALALSETHRRLYRTGVLAQEREVIAIEALKRLGKARAAEQRATSVRNQQPHSIHESRIRDVLGDASVETTP